ncbi:hypothetical protein AAKU67_000932 [Oxalobacteraceae bacterium GrIS 2.11]
MITVQLPAQLANFCLNTRTHIMEATTLSEVFKKFDEIAPMLRSQLFYPNGQLRQFVGLFLNDKQITLTEEEHNRLAQESQLLIVLSVAGG